MKDRSKFISITTTCAMLVLMACIGLYYMQNDYDAVSYIKAFAYLVLTVSSVFALVFTAGDSDRRDLAFASTAFSIIMFASAVFALIPTLGNYSTSLAYLAIAFAAPFALGFIAKLATGLKIFEKVIVKLALLVIGILTVVIFAIMPIPVMGVVFKVVAGIWVVIFLAGTVFSVINLVKNKETFINWAYLFFALPYAWYCAQLTVSSYSFRKTAAAIAMVALSFLVTALVCKEEK